MQRVQFLLSDSGIEQLERLVEDTGLKTRTQVMNAALTLLEWAVKERQSGRIIAAMDEKSQKYKEVILAGLPPVSAEPAPKATTEPAMVRNEAAVRRVMERNNRYKAAGS